MSTLGLLPLPCMMLKNSRTYFKHFAVFKLLDFSSMSVWPFVNIMYERVKNVKLVFPRLTLPVGGSHPEVLFLWSPFYTTKRTSVRIKIQIQQKFTNIDTILFYMFICDVYSNIFL